MDYLSTTCFVNNIPSSLIDINLLCGAVIQIMAQFALRAFKDQFETVQMILFLFWFGQSVVFLAMGTNGPAALHRLVRLFL